MEVRKQSNKYYKYLLLIFSAILFAGLFFISRYSYTLYHSFIEIFAIIVAASIFIVTWNSRELLDNKYLLFLGIAYVFIAFLDLIHMLSYPGLGVFPGFGTNLAAQLWIFARYLESLSLLIAALFINRKLQSIYIFIGYCLILTLFLLSVFYWRIFPNCFVEGTGLTPFKKISEYIISVILAISIVLPVLKRRDFDKQVLRLIVASIIIKIFSEIAFTHYTDPYGFFNLIGHYLKLISFYLIYEAIVVTGLVRPLDILFRKLKVSEAELKEKTNRLEQTNKDLESFSYSVSHDLRAPLRHIGGFIELLQDRVINIIDKKSLEYIKIISNSAKRMSNLIDGILTISGISHSEIRKEKINLFQLVKDVIKEMGRDIEDRGMVWKIGKLPIVCGDSVLLRLVFTNLISNAVKFTRSCKLAEIEIGYKDKVSEFIFFIRDNGIGFEMDYADKLFKMFQRLHSQDEFEGIGIGLASVRRIIDHHRGRTWAEGKINEGATIYFSLPK